MRSADILKKTHHRKKRPPMYRGYLSNATTAYNLARERRLTGSAGAASPVRRIDPITGEVIEILINDQAMN
jgi:hypothetical protein